MADIERLKDLAVDIASLDIRIDLAEKHLVKLKDERNEILRQLERIVEEFKSDGNYIEALEVLDKYGVSYPSGREKEEVKVEEEIKPVTEAKKKTKKIQAKKVRTKDEDDGQLSWI